VSQAEEKIAAVVVTYNRKDLLGQCLDSLLRQSRRLDALYIIDNHSSDGTYDDLLARNLIAPADDAGSGPVETTRPAATGGMIHYVRMAENTGGAGGFHEGMKRATAAGFDWLWLMDDDLLTAPDALEVLVQKRATLRSRGKDSVLLNSLVLARDGADGDVLAFPLQELTARGYWRRVYHWRLSEVQDQVQDGLYRWACPFNGTLVPARAVVEVGLPNKDFFLWGDERDFLWRAAKRFELYTAVDSRVFHPPGRAAGFDWRQYYGIRNALLINRHFRLPALRNAKLILSSLVKGLRHGRFGLLLVVRAIRDGLTGRLGRREEYHP